MFFICLKQQHRTYVSWNWQSWRRRGVTAGSSNSLQQLLRFFSVPPFAMNNQEQFERLFGNTCCSQWSWLALQIQRDYHAICYLFSHHLNSKNNFVFLYDLILRHWTCFLSSVATNGNDHAMDTEGNLANVFKFFFAYKNHKKVVSASW